MQTAPGARRRAKVAEEEAATARQVRQRVAPAKKEELQPIEHASHNKVGPAPWASMMPRDHRVCWCWAAPPIGHSARKG